MRNSPQAAPDAVGPLSHHPTNGTAPLSKPSRRRQWRRVSVVVLEVRHQGSIWVHVPPVLKAKDVAQIVRDWLGNLDREWFVVLCVDANYQLTALHHAVGGTLQHERMSPREVFAIAMKYPTAAIWIAHNHPTGPLYPTPEDVDSTDQLVLVGALHEIPILDHVILGPKRSFLSFADEGLLLPGEELWDNGGILRLGRLFMRQQTALIRDFKAGRANAGPLVGP